MNSVNASSSTAGLEMVEPTLRILGDLVIPAMN